MKLKRFEKLNGVEGKEVKINGRLYIQRILCECVCGRVREEKREEKGGKGEEKREEERREKTIMKRRS